RRLTRHLEQDTRREVAVADAGALVAPRLSDFHGPGLTVDVHDERAVGIAEARLDDGAGQLEILAAGPAPTVMRDRRRRHDERRDENEKPSSHAHSSEAMNHRHLIRRACPPRAAGMQMEER